MDAVDRVNMKAEARAKSRKNLYNDNLKLVQIRFYANGIEVNRTTFYPFISQEAHTFTKDILDGFMPTTLRSQFPEGF